MLEFLYNLNFKVPCHRTRSHPKPILFGIQVDHKLTLSQHKCFTKLLLFFFYLTPILTYSGNLLEHKLTLSQFMAQQVSRVGKIGVR